MILGGIILLMLAVFGAPLFAVIATSAMLGYQRDDTDLMNMALEIQSIADMPFLAAIPLFTFAGYVLSESEAPKRLVRLTSSLLGWMPGGTGAGFSGCLRIFHGIYRGLWCNDHCIRRDFVPGAQARRLSRQIQSRPGNFIR